MLRSNSKSLGNSVVSPGEEKERLQWEGFTENGGFNNNNNDNNNSHDNVCGAVITTKVIARVHPVHLMNVD